MGRRRYEGGCHCGAVRFALWADLKQETILDCSCSICRKKGFLHLIIEPEDFELVRGEEALRVYTFNTGVARHRFCARCGIHAFYSPRSHPEKIDVNLRCVEGVELEAVQIEAFDGQNWEENVGSIQ